MIVTLHLDIEDIILVLDHTQEDIILVHIHILDHTGIAIKNQEVINEIVIKNQEAKNEIVMENQKVRQEQNLLLHLLHDHLLEVEVLLKF